MKISRKIVGYSVNKPAEPSSAEESGTADGTDSQSNDKALADVIQMHETLQRPHKLVGSTYKLKTPDHVSSHAMYITINDIVLNEGTEHELRRPFEVFINSKNLEHYQWIVALTLIMSAVFRKGGDITFLVDELRSVFDPRGGYWNKGKYMPSIIAEIGDVIERHLIDIGMLKSPEHAAPQANSESNAVEESAEPIADIQGTDSQGTGTAETDTCDKARPSDWSENASFCSKCNQKSVVVRDGCQTCMSCGDSKCG